MKPLWGIWFGCALLGCTPLKDGADRDSGPRDDRGDATRPDMPVVTPPSRCGDVNARPWVMATRVTTNTTWDCNVIHELGVVIFVEPGATLTIEPGTLIIGRTRTALVVQRGAAIRAMGTQREPIVFTSAKDPGSRAQGDWGGVVLLGSAPTNLNTVTAPPTDGGTGDASVTSGLVAGEGRIEGLPDTDDRTRFGGPDMMSDCGTLQYVRIEFAGYRFAKDNELNGLTLGGCGSRTTIDYVQVHMGSDDGIEAFGGTVGLRHVLITRAADDGFDWDNGYRGRVQFLVVQQDPDALQANNGFEGDNSGQPYAFDAMPRSQPTIYNATLVGSGAPRNMDDRDPELGMLIRRGSQAIVRNTIVLNFPAGALNVESAQSAAATASGGLTVENSVFYNLGADGMTFFAPESGAGDDNGFDEAAFFRSGDRHNTFGMDPQLARPIDRRAPSFVPRNTSIVGRGAATPPQPNDFFDPLVNYIGAFAPGGPDWTEGWAAYPDN